MHNNSKKSLIVITFSKGFYLIFAKIRFISHLRKKKKDFVIFKQKDLKKLNNKYKYQILENQKLDLWGAGFYSWKPVIVHDAFKRISIGNYLLYVDIGCDLNLGENLDLVLQHFEKGNYHVLISTVESKSGLVNKIGAAEKFWTFEPLIRRYGLSDFEMNSPQFAATWFLIRKTILTQELIHEWVDRSFEENSYFLKGEDKKGESSHFAHRHDQSILSCILKFYMRDKGLKILRSSEMKNFDLVTPSRNLWITKKRSIYTQIINKALYKIRIIVAKSKYL